VNDVRVIIHPIITDLNGTECEPNGTENGRVASYSAAQLADVLTTDVTPRHVGLEHVPS